MSALRTQSIPQIEANAAAAPCREHGWVTESRHRTSTGTIVYSRCAGCDTRRVEWHAPGNLLAAPLSRQIAAPGFLRE